MRMLCWRHWLTLQVLQAPSADLCRRRLCSPSRSFLPQVAFTGHSLGGSLGTLLMLMYVRRGVLPKSAVSPVYTFGAPAIFCEGTGACACPPPAAGTAGAEGSVSAGSASGRGEGKGACGVLQMLGLPEGAVRWVRLRGRSLVGCVWGWGCCGGGCLLHSNCTVSTRSSPALFLTVSSLLRPPAPPAPPLSAGMFSCTRTLCPAPLPATTPWWQTCSSVWQTRSASTAASTAAAR